MGWCWPGEGYKTWRGDAYQEGGRARGGGKGGQREIKRKFRSGQVKMYTVYHYNNFLCDFYNVIFILTGLRS